MMMKVKTPIALKLLGEVEDALTPMAIQNTLIMVEDVTEKDPNLKETHLNTLKVTAIRLWTS